MPCQPHKAFSMRNRFLSLWLRQVNGVEDEKLGRLDKKHSRVCSRALVIASVLPIG